jgi:hypothetical protein
VTGRLAGNEVGDLVKGQKTQSLLSSGKMLAEGGKIGCSLGFNIKRF